MLRWCEPNRVISKRAIVAWYAVFVIGPETAPTPQPNGSNPCNGGLPTYHGFPVQISCPLYVRNGSLSYYPPGLGR